MSSADFSSFGKFLRSTVNDDRRFLAETELDRLPQTACGMSNGSGGWIIIGAAQNDDDFNPSPAPPQVLGVSAAESLRERITADLGSAGLFSVPLSLSSCVIDDAGAAAVIVVRVAPLDWHMRPVCAGQNFSSGVFRRIEGTDVASGLRARFRLAMDALERLRSDLPMPGAGVSALDQDSVASFREAVLHARPEWASLPLNDVLRRSLILSGDTVTQAGYHMLGQRGARVRSEMNGAEVRGLWRAWTEILPAITCSVPKDCAAAVRECFLNAILHADYDDGRGIIVRGVAGRFIVIQNPGLPRTLQKGVSACRNFRIMKIFQLLGAARGTGSGMSLVRRFDPDFELDQDAMELSTASILRLKPAEYTVSAQGAASNSAKHHTPAAEVNSSMFDDFAREYSDIQNSEAVKKVTTFGSAADELTAAIRISRSQQTDSDD